MMMRQANNALACFSGKASAPDARIRLKVVVVGELGCGKSSLTQQKLMSAPTIGLELSVKMVEAPDGTPIKCQIWDCSGKMMSGIQPNYLANACAVVLCYDISSLSSFTALKDWLSFARRSCNADRKREGRSITFALVGTKADVRGEPAVTGAEHDAFAAAHGIRISCRTSATAEEAQTVWSRVALAHVASGGRMLQ